MFGLYLSAILIKSVNVISAVCVLERLRKATLPMRRQAADGGNESMTQLCYSKARSVSHPKRCTKTRDINPV